MIRHHDHRDPQYEVLAPQSAWCHVDGQAAARFSAQPVHASPIHNCENGSSRRLRWIRLALS